MNIKNKPQYKVSQGFTLLEIVVAIGIFAIMAAMAYSGLNNVLIARQQTDAHSQQLQKVQTAMVWLARDIEQLVDRGVRNEYGDNVLPLVGQDHEGYLIELTRGGWRNPANQARSHLQRVAYAVQEEELVRVYWQVLDRAEDSKARKNVLVDGIKSLEIRYLGGDNDWHTSWPVDRLGSDAATTLPRAIEVTLDTKQYGKLKRLFRVVVV